MLGASNVTLSNSWLHTLLNKTLWDAVKKKKKTERKSFYPEQRLKKISEEKIIKMKLNFDI